MLTIYCYKNCSTCKKAIKWLTTHNIEFLEKDIVKEHPDKNALKAIYQKSGLPLKKFFNTSGKLYKENHLKEKLPTMSEEEQLSLLSSEGMLIKRPLLVNDDLILLGFKEDDYKNLL